MYNKTQSDHSLLYLPEQPLHTVDLLSQLHLSRINACLEVRKSGSCFNMEILQQVTKYCGKEEKLLLRSNFSSFPQYFQYISSFWSQITYIFVICGCSIYFFLGFANLICRGTHISKYFRESLGLRDKRVDCNS